MSDQLQRNISILLTTSFAGYVVGAISKDLGLLLWQALCMGIPVGILIAASFMIKWPEKKKKWGSEE